jgi:hypothetical protein
MKLVISSRLSISLVGGYALAGGTQTPEAGPPQIVRRPLAWMRLSAKLYGS